MSQQVQTCTVYRNPQHHPMHPPEEGQPTYGTHVIMLLSEKMFSGIDFSKVNLSIHIFVCLFET